MNLPLSEVLKFVAMGIDPSSELFADIEKKLKFGSEVANRLRYLNVKQGDSSGVLDASDCQVILDIETDCFDLFPTDEVTE